MQYCQDIRPDLLPLLQGQLSESAKDAVQRHLDQCPSCAEELRVLGDTWQELPSAVNLVPPADVRGRVLAYAEKQAGLSTRARTRHWRLGRRAIPLVAGPAIGLAVVGLAHLRGAIAPLAPPVQAVLSLSFAALMAVVAGSLFRASIPRALRATLTGAVGAFGGYLLLSAVLPIADTVTICGEAVFGNEHLSLGRLCTLYLLVTASYAAIPMAIVAYGWDRSNASSRGVAEALVFALLTAPLLLLQSGFDAWLIPVSVLGGFAGGAVLGELLGHRARSWVLQGS